MSSDPVKKDFLWNAAGSLAVAAASVVLAFLTMRVLGAEDGGVFGFGFSTFGQQMFLVAYFGIRPFHITDTKGEYSFSVYRSLRVRTTMMALLAAVVLAAVLTLSGSWTVSKGLCILAITGWKLADGYADVYESECQRAGFLWRGGRELFWRTLAAVAVFSAVCVLTRSLMAAAVSALFTQAAAVAIFRRRLVKTEPAVFAAFENAAKNDRTDRMPAGKQGLPALSPAEKSLLAGTVLLFLGVFLDFFIVSSAKYAIDLNLTDTASGIFNLLFMPANFIYLAANFVMRPCISRMSQALDAGDRQSYTRQKKQLLLLIAGLSVLCLAGAAVLGRWGLGIFERLLGETYRGQLTAHTGDFVLIIAGGCLYAFANLYYYCLVIRRRQKRIFAVYLAAAVLSAAASAFLVKHMELTGAAVSYAASMSLVLFGFLMQDKILEEDLPESAGTEK